MYRIEVTASAAKALRKLDAVVQKRIARKIDALATEPRPEGVRKLEGERNLYRIRVGDFRVLYRIENRILLILVIAIENRRDVYRKMRT